MEYEVRSLTSEIRKLTEILRDEDAAAEELEALVEEEKKLKATVRKGRLKRLAPRRSKRRVAPPPVKKPPASDGSEQKLKKVQQRIKELDAHIAEMADARKERRELAERRAKQLASMPVPAIPELENCERRLKNLDVEIGYIESDMDKVDIALTELSRAKTIMTSARNEMRRASSDAEADIYVGGLIGMGLSIRKHAKIEDASRLSSRAAPHLVRAKKILQELNISDTALHFSRISQMSNTMQMLDLFMDGWIVDSMVADRVQQMSRKAGMSVATIAHKIRELKHFFAKLETERERVLDMYEDIEIERDDAVADALASE